MSESGFSESFDNMLFFFGIVMMLAYSFCIYKMYHGIFGYGRTRGGKMAEASIPAVYFAVLLVLKLVPYDIEAVFVYIVAITATFILSCLLYRSDMYMKVYIGITFFALQYICHNISMGFSAIFLSLRDTVMGDVSYTVQDMVSYAAVDILTVSITFLLLYASVAAILKQFGDRDGFTGIEMLFLIVPSLAASLNAYLMSAFISDSWDHGFRDLFAAGSGYNILSIVNGFVSIVCIVVVAVLFKNLTKRKDGEKTRMMLENQIKDIKLRLEKADKANSVINALKHDYRNHIHTLGALIRKGDMAEANMYIEKLGDVAETFGTRIHTGNPVTDVIINETDAVCRDNGIRFHSDLCFPSGLDISAFDLSVVLNNALDNAVAACRLENGKKAIWLGSVIKKGMYIVTVKNIFTGSIDTANGGLPETTRPDKSGHGIGLENIKAVAEKYGGGIDIAVRDGAFILTVLMTCTQAKKEGASHVP